MSEDKRPNEMTIPADQPPTAGTAPTMVTSEGATMAVSEEVLAITNAFVDRLLEVRAIATEPVADAVAAGRALERVVAACDRELKALPGAPRKVEVTFVTTGGGDDDEG